MIQNVILWIVVLALAFFVGKLVSKMKLPTILGWLITGMIFGPHAFGLLKTEVLAADWYKTIIMWMQCAFGLMLGTELIWEKKLWKGTDGNDTDTVSRNIYDRVTCIWYDFSIYRSPGISWVCVWRNCTGDSTGTGIVDCQRVSCERAGCEHLASNGSSG